MPDPLIYLAAEEVAARANLKPLSGTRRSAQRYVDRITSTDWWKNNCPGWDKVEDPAPERVWVWEGTAYDGAYVMAGLTATLRDKEWPCLVIGHGKVNNGLEAISDRWVLLHELAHVMTMHVKDGDHGKSFLYAFHSLVRQFLGAEWADDLARTCKSHGIRLNYRLLIPIASATVAS